jgi:hypothetical protein
MARARRAPFNRQGLEFKTASLQRAVRLFVQLLLLRLSKKQQPKKVQSRLSFARQTVLISEPFTLEQLTLKIREVLTA